MRCHRCGLQKNNRGRCQQCGATVHNLSNLEFDEVSFVKRGANQKAHVVLFKSGEGADMPASTWELLAAAAHRYPNLPTPQAVSKVLEETPGLYDPDTPPPSWQEPISKAASTWELQKHTIGEDLSPQEVLAALESDPELYQP